MSAADDYMEGDGDDEVYAKFDSGLLPMTPEDLLTPEQHEQLRRDLNEMQKRRRQAEADAAGWVLP